MVDVLLTVAPISTSLEGVSLGGKSSSRAAELEGPQEVVGFLEVGSHSVDFIDQIFNGRDSLLSEGFLNQSIGGKRDTLPVNFAISSLKDKFADGFAGRISECDVRFNTSEHIGGSFVDSNEDSVMELSESEESHDADNFGVEFVNTADPHNECQTGLSWDVNLTGELGLDHRIFTFLRASISALVSFR